MARDMKKICSGTRRDEGIKWFTQLSDKGKETFLVQDRSFRRPPPNNSIFLSLQQKPPKLTFTGP